MTRLHSWRREYLCNSALPTRRATAALNVGHGRTFCQCAYRMGSSLGSLGGVSVVGITGETPTPPPPHTHPPPPPPTPTTHPHPPTPRLMSEPSRGGVSTSRRGDGEHALALLPAFTQRRALPSGHQEPYFGPHSRSSLGIHSPHGLPVANDLEVTALRERDRVLLELDVERVEGRRRLNLNLSPIRIEGRRW